jgi:diguanylate cyclase (GGDEF)-like protein/PAS domain S-box-containing protein
LGYAFQLINVLVIPCCDGQGGLFPKEKGMPVKPYSKVRLSVCALSLVLLLLSWGYLALTFWHERSTIETQTERHVQSLAKGFEEYFRRFFRDQDLLLLNIVERLRHGHQPVELRQVLAQWLARSDQLGGLLIADPVSRTVLTRVARTPFPDQFEFAVPENSQTPITSLQVAESLYRDPAGAHFLLLTRQLRVGSENYLVIALLRSEDLLDFYPFADFGEGGSISLLHKNGALLARQPQAPELLGRSFAGEPLFTTQLQRQSTGLSRSPATGTGEHCVLAYRLLDALPLVIAVETSIDRALAGWQSRLINFLIIQSTFSFAILLSTLLLVRALTRMETSEQQLREREEHFRAVADSSVDGVMSIDQQGRVSFWSHGAQRIFGYAENAARDMPLTALLDFDRSGPILEILAELALDSYQQSLGGTVAARGIRSNGWLFPVELTVSIGRVHRAPVYTLIVRDVTERRLLEEKVRRMASHDGLTRLPNRTLLMDRLEVAIAQVRREGGSFALLFLDLDDFKPVNDQFGHEVGDQLLEQVADRLLASFRASDTVARVGGDEFAILLHHVQDRAAIAKSCHSLITSLGQEYVVGGNRATIGCSIGVALFSGQQLTGSDLMRLADAAMYQAKRAGKNCYQVVACGEAAASPKPDSLPPDPEPERG